MDKLSLLDLDFTSQKKLEKERSTYYRLAIPILTCAKNILFVFNPWGFSVKKENQPPEDTLCIRQIIESLQMLEPSYLEMLGEKTVNRKRLLYQLLLDFELKKEIKLVIDENEISPAN